MFVYIISKVGGANSRGRDMKLMGPNGTLRFVTVEIYEKKDFVKISLR